MKDVILFRGIRKDVSQYTQALTSMIYKDQLYGEELVDFNQYDKEFDGFISGILGEKLKSTEHSGLFRKPYDTIHFENFNQQSRYVFMLVYEDTVFKTYRHKELGCDNVFGIDKSPDEFVSENCADVDKWEETGSIKLYIGDAICFRPWLWHGLQNSLVQVFYIEEDNSKEVTDE